MATQFTQPNTPIAESVASGPTYLTIKQWADRWKISYPTIVRREKSDPTYPRIHRFGPRSFRVSLEDIERYEQKYNAESRLTPTKQI